MSASVHALRGQQATASRLQEESRNTMIAVSPDRWGRNQHY
jgi:hypothetical protein